MPPVNIIDAVQQKYAALTAWSGQPDTLWFGSGWPRNASGNLIAFPVFKFEHEGTPNDTTFEGTAVEDWRFRFTILDTTIQLVQTHFDRVRFNGASPDSRSGFWYGTVTMPDGYVFKQFIPVGDYVFDFLDQYSSPAGSPSAQVTFSMSLLAHRSTFS